MGALGLPKKIDRLVFRFARFPVVYRPFAMPLVPPSSAAHTRLDGSAPRPHVLRWSVVLAIVLVLHATVAAWIARERKPFPPPAEKPPVQVQLLQPERIEQAPSATSHPPPRVPKARPTPPAAGRARPAPAPGENAARHAATPAPVLQSVTPKAPAAVPSPRDATSMSASAPVSASAPIGPSGNAAALDGARAGGNAENAGAGAGASGPPRQGLKFAAPPSGDLRYDTFYNGMRNAPSTIHWASDGVGYAMVISIPLPFVGEFRYESEGRIDAFGLAPQRYVETRGRRGQNVTTFDRETRHIAFTRTPVTIALPDGAQDRFSVVMQLASLVRGDPEAYKPGVTRNFYVADNDSGETWPMESMGDETVSAPAGFVEARRFMRLPRHAGDARRLDVWLAPALGWLPVRIMQTEPNGTQIELVWSGALVPTGVKNAPSASKDSATDATAPPTLIEP
jgi:hypothetical protein